MFKSQKPEIFDRVSASKTSAEEDSERSVRAACVAIATVICYRFVIVCSSSGAYTHATEQDHHRKRHSAKDSKSGYLPLEVRFPRTRHFKGARGQF